MSQDPTQFVDELIERLGTSESQTIPVLQAIQKEFKYLPEEALQRVCEISEITPARITGVSTFYSQFRHKPAGEHSICVCIGTACHVKGAERVIEAFARYLGVPKGDDTSPDQKYTIERVACLGCCTLAPVVQIGENVYGHVHPPDVANVLDDYAKRLAGGDKKKRYLSPDGEDLAGEIRLGLGSCCQARGSAKVQVAVEDAISKTGRNVRLKPVGCVGVCAQTPLVDIVMPDKTQHLYVRVEPDEVAPIIRKHFPPKGVFRRMKERVSGGLEHLLDDASWTPVEHYDANHRDAHLDDVLSPQKHIATECCGELNPLDLQEYRDGGGFDAYEKCIREWTQDQIIEIITDSGLRGRGGAGFPTGKKWSFVKAQQTDQKYVVCNGDEGDPGAFMDRMLLESYPFRVLEGLAIAAWAVGASQGYLYIRAEYPLAVQRVNEAIRQMEEHKLLGDDILGTGRSLHLHIMEGAGAFVCGEETALLESIEGYRGMPRLRPPYPAVKGLWGKPTLVNNVETLANVSWIMRHGPAAFRGMGTATSNGTKVFALAGKIERGGLIEVPMGMTIREVVYQIGGGCGGGKKFKAVQIGGPSGGCVPEWLSDTKVDYESLTSVGAMMGSGGLVVLDEDDCMVDIARYFLQFTQDQSCGKCSFCRIGTRRMLEILDDLCEGRGKKGDPEKLEELAESIQRGSLCGLGKTAPNPVLSTLKYFREEYEAHAEGRCPAGKCPALVDYVINEECIGCTKCAQICPVEAIKPLPHRKHEVDTELCVRCGACRDICPVDAVEIH